MAAVFLKLKLNIQDNTTSFTFVGNFERISYLIGGGVGDLDNGKLATSLDIAKDLMDPNAWSGLRGAPRTDAMPLKCNENIS